MINVVPLLIAYVPDDPRHPLKEYASFTDFMKELMSQLRSPDYQQFFSRFVAHQKTMANSLPGFANVSPRSPGRSVSRWTWGRGGGRDRG